MINKYRFIIKKNGEPNSHCFCRHPDLIENYDKAIADNTQTWEVHHRREEFYSKKELIERGEYYDVPPEELIFLTQTEHRKLDSRCQGHSEVMKGKKHSEESKKKMSKAKSKRILCVETSEVFDSIMDANRKTEINRGSISRVCNGKLNTTGGYHWRFV